VLPADVRVRTAMIGVLIAAVTNRASLTSAVADPTK